MSFMDSLAQNPSGSGIFGNPGATSYGNGDVLDLVNKLKDRELRDFKEKSNFMSDLSLKQDRLKQRFAPQGQEQNQGDLSNPNQRGMNVVYHDPNAMTGYEKGELGIRQKGLDLETKKLAQSSKLGEEALGVKTAQEKLNEQKNAGVHEKAMADLQRKIDDSNNKLGLAYEQLNNKNNTIDQQLKLHQTIAENTKVYHDAQMAQQKAEADRKFVELQKLHEATIAKMKDDADKRANTHEVKKDQNGNVITTDTQRGTQPKTINAIGKDGKTYPIPEDKINDLDADGTPHWKRAGGSDNENNDEDQTETGEE